MPRLRADIAGGNFTGLYDWLKTNVHQHGKKNIPADLTKLGRAELVGYFMQPR